MAPQAPAAASTAAGAHPAVLDAARELASASAPQANAAANVTTRDSAAALPATYTVRRGDSLSSIARRLYHDRADWPALYWRNHKRIHWADDIYAGQVLRVPAKPEQAPRPPAALDPPAPAGLAPSATSSRIPAQAIGSSAAVTSESASGTPGGAFGACVVARESGGNAQIMNATGHYGLYQFSEPTWIAYGGSAADFGHASVAEQNQVFANALAAGGESNWAPYDGC